MTKILAHFSGRLYPDYTFSIGYNPHSKIKKSERDYELQLRNQEEPSLESKIDWLLGNNKICGESCSISGRPLFIKGLKSSRNSRGKYGSNGITKYGRRVVKNSALLLERKYGKKRLGFVTCTLPNFGATIQHRINGVWGEIVRRFYQKIKRQLAKVNAPCEYVGVTEIQEKRFRKTGVPVPHLHFVYLARPSHSGRYWIYICQIHRAWNMAVREGINFAGYPYTEDEKHGWGSCHAKRVKKSSSAYLGKYMSKGSSVLKQMSDEGWDEFPCQWWQASASVKELFKKSIVHLGGEVCSWFFYHPGSLIEDEIVTYVDYVSVVVGGVSRVVGLVGCLTKESYWALAG